MKYQYFRFHNKLAQFRPINDGVGQDFWEQRWSRHDIVKLHESYRSGKLDGFESIFSKYLPKNLPVLEAGCGMGQLVVGLNACGYQVEGIDYAEETINKLHVVSPELNFRVGDVNALDVEDGYYGGYISIGIFEHNSDGPLDGLMEACRVLHSEGVALISVPYLNRGRSKLLSKVLSSQTIEGKNRLVFYQYYFSIKEFTDFLNEAGFETIEIYPYALYSGLTRDIPFWGWLHAKGFFVWPIHSRFIRWCKNAPYWIRYRWAHMVMFVCKKKK